MSFFRIRLIVFALVFLVVGLFLWLLATPRRSISVPLSSIISTSGQGELQSATSAYRMVGGEKQYVVPIGEAIQYFFDATKGRAVSNVFLVDAPDQISALAVSGRVFIGYGAVDTPVALNQPNPPRGNYWLVVFTGIAGSDPVRWIVEDVVVNQDKIVFSYHKNPLGISTCDIHHYYYWIPLGNLDDGIYHLELYETKLKATTLMRRVQIGQATR